MPQKDLKVLLENYPLSARVPSVTVSGIAVDSREVKPGDVFAATSDRIDGHQYIPHAIQQGAAAVIGSKDLSLAVPYVRVDDCRGALAHLSAAFYDHPANELTMIGVTGSDGKTTTVNFIYQILLAAGLRAGMISTVQTPLPIFADTDPKI